MRLWDCRGMSLGGRSPPESSDPEQEDDPDRLDDLAPVDLRDPRAAVFEQDRRLADPAPDLPAAEQEFLQERVAARPDPGQVDLRQLRNPVAAERAAVVP